MRCTFGGSRKSMEKLCSNKKLIFCTIALFLTTYTFVGNPWKQVFSHEPLFALGTRLVRNDTEMETSMVSHPLRKPISSNHTGVNILLYWTHYQDRPVFYNGLGQKPFSGCPVKNCLTTANRSLLRQARAVLFNGFYMNATDLPEHRRQDQQFVFYMMESPMRKVNLLNSLDYFFNITMTYHRHADVFSPYGTTVAGKQTGELPEFSKRVRAAAWVVSHCSTHSKREEYVQKLARHLVVDIYGRCGTLKCPSDQGGGRNAEACYRTLAASHFFYLSFENSLCEDYITEKFWHALRAGIVPVVRGASPESYRRVAPPNSFIHVQDFASVQLLATYLTSLMENRTAYESYFAWRNSYRVGWYPAFCHLCAYVSRKQPTKSVKISEVWGIDRSCVRPDVTDKE
ncbi:alpha-(1,3)-fucosyltransferase 7-like isoform X1 [Pollicipes pollicipes]|uniref:alpha-(1,3)-fucosyltransferase 7-like isoform X1 n=1 Tax=Pollicipes pollicipes TaxID=41117 RepID=UPI001884E04B|nr:alpha-(1,3)-fucosyltransferase 7-like isoform X1 [Pollicipes pollicipes]